ncbi:MAG: FtsX-like permease family protein [Verrucomicrobia bacterium]|nr:FtsX-like permease family protein [Verrucomicrobiota bacterium]
MTLVRIAWRNIGRNKRRSILSALAVSFACAVLIFSMALQRGSYADMIYNTVHAHTGHLQVQRAGYWPDRTLARRVTSPDAIMAVVRALPHVRAVAPRVNAAGLVSKGKRTFGGLIFGIDPVREKALSTMADVIREGKYIEEGDREGVLVGSLLAENLGAGVGDEIVFLGQGADGSLAAGRLVVRGLIKTGVSEMDRTTLAAPLATIQDAYSMNGGVSEVAVLLDRDKYRHEVAGEIERKLRERGLTNAAVLEWPTLLPGVEQSIRIDWNSGLIMYAALVLVVGFGIANTFLMAFMERMHELGVLLALGMRPASLSLMVYLESVLLVLLGVVGGLAMGIPITRYFQVRGLDFGVAQETFAEYGLSPVIHPELSLLVLAWAIGIVVLISLAAAIYPAVKAARVKPVEALRHT